MNFATLYGQGSHALSRQLGIDYATAKQYIEEYFAQFPKVKAWMAQVLVEGREKGYVETIWGRKRYMPELNSQNHMFRSAGERAAVNHPIQGTSADMIKQAMVDINKALGGRQKAGVEKENYSLVPSACCLILQVHDELLFECDPDLVKEIAEMVKKKMEDAIQLDVPVIAEVKVGPNWGEMEKLMI